MILFLAFICLQNLIGKKTLGRPLLINCSPSLVSVDMLVLSRKLLLGFLKLPVKSEVSKVISLFVKGNLFNWAAVGGKNSDERH